MQSFIHLLGKCRLHEGAKGRGRRDLTSLASLFARPQTQDPQRTPTSLPVLGTCLNNPQKASSSTVGSELFTQGPMLRRASRLRFDALGSS